MKKIVRIGLSASLVLFFLGTVEAQKIRTEEGVVVVSNGKKPTPPPGQSASLTLTEELTLGISENPDENFSEVSYLVVDREGNIIGLDIKEQKIKMFDKNGKFIRAIGKQGQGPGEFGLAAGIQLTGDNLLMVEDNAHRRLILFKPTGEFVKYISLADKLGLVSLLLDEQGNYLGREVVFSDNNEKMFFVAKKFDQDLKPLFTFDRIEAPIPGPNTKTNYMEMMSFYQFGPAGKIYYGRNKNYDIKIYNPEGKHIRTIEKEYDRTKLTQEDIDERHAGSPDKSYMERFEFPEYFPPFQSFRLDEQGRLFVRTFTKGKAKGEYVVDVFDAEGRFIAQFISKSDLKLFKKNKAYGVEKTTDGFVVIKRYKVT